MGFLPFLLESWKYDGIFEAPKNVRSIKKNNGATIELLEYYDYKQIFDYSELSKIIKMFAAFLFSKQQL